MGNLLFIDSDDIIGLSDALRNALEKRGVIFSGNGTYGYLTTDDEEPDIDPYLGNMPPRRKKRKSCEDYSPSYGGCGYSYGGCGGSGNRSASCGSGGCGFGMFGGC